MQLCLLCYSSTFATFYNLFVENKHKWVVLSTKTTAYKRREIISMGTAHRPHSTHLFHLFGQRLFQPHTWQPTCSRCLVAGFKVERRSLSSSHMCDFIVAITAPVTSWAHQFTAHM